MRETLGGLRGKHGTLWRYRAMPPRETTHSHDELEFNLVIRGSVSYLVDGRRHELQRRSLLWLFPAHEHLLARPSPDAVMWIGVLRRSAMSGLSSRLSATLRADVPSGPIHHRLAAGPAHWLHQLATALERMRAPADRPDSDAFSTGLLHLFTAAWEACASAGDEPGSGTPLHPAVAEAIRLLDAGDERPLAVLARVVDLERSVLSRRFRRDTGLTIADYRTRCRLERFSELADGRRTLLAAALAAGFGSYAQFHRVFTRIHGRTPRDAAPRHWSS
jgi:AraC-like DNA-binding protein